MKDGTVKCWGGNDRGQLGDGTQQDRHAPVKVATPGAVKQLALGAAHTCALVDGAADSAKLSVYCWGADKSGQLGDGETRDRPAPGPVNM
jgi:alpha-tubulin suppressor-like RCC1 family protein